jgi:DNA-binding CsgD family transcriptional regulator
MLPPTDLTALVSQLRAEYHLLDERARAVTGVLDQLEQSCAVREQPRPAGTEQLHDAHALNAKLVELASTVTSSVRALCPNVAGAQELAAGYPLEQAVLARGVELRAVYPHAARRQRDMMSHLRRLQDEGGQPRTAAALPTQLIILDDEAALLPTKAGCDGSAALVRDPSVLAFLDQLFEHIWDRARPIVEFDYDTEVWRDIEVAILVELGCGRSDEAISRRLGISTRTLRRYLAELCERFEVHTRFQLGVAAARAGLLPTTTR